MKVVGSGQYVVRIVWSTVTVESSSTHLSGHDVIVNVVGLVMVYVSRPQVNVVGSGQYVVKMVCSEVTVISGWEPYVVETAVLGVVISVETSVLEIGFLVEMVLVESTAEVDEV